MKAKYKFEPDPFTYVNFIKLYISIQSDVETKRKYVDAILREALTRGFKEDIYQIMFNVIIDKFCVLKDQDSIIYYINLMRKSNIPENAATFVPLMNFYLKENNLKLATDICKVLFLNFLLTVV